MAVENQVVIDKLTKKSTKWRARSSILTRLNSWCYPLFEKMGLPLEYTKKTKTGYSTAVDVLERLAPIAPNCS